MAHETSPKLEEINRTDAMDIPMKSFKMQQSKARSNTVPSKLNHHTSVDDEVFHHLAVQLSMIDNLAQRDGSRSGTPELHSHSPTKGQSPDPTGVNIDLAHYSGMAPSSVEAEAPSNKYFEFSGAMEEESPEEPLPEKRERQASIGDSPALLKLTGVCARLDYPRVKITGKNSIADFAGVSTICYVVYWYAKWFSYNKVLNVSIAVWCTKVMPLVIESSCSSDV